MRRVLLFCVLGGLAVCASAFVPTGSARGDSAPRQFVLNTNDRLEIPGTRVACRVTRKAAKYTNRLACYLETKSQSYTPAAGSYAIELAEGGIGVIRIGVRKPVFSHAVAPPPGVPAGSGRATALFGGFAHLSGRKDQAFVAGTNIVCRPYGKHTLAILCVMLGSDGHVHDGTYLAWISNRGILIAQARNGRAVPVFQRLHGR